MRESAERAQIIAQAEGRSCTIRYDKPEHYIEDLRNAGFIQLIKREITEQTD
jgi:hypothetical protein